MTGMIFRANLFILIFGNSTQVNLSKNFVVRVCFFLNNFVYDENVSKFLGNKILKFTDRERNL